MEFKTLYCIILLYYIVYASSRIHVLKYSFRIYFSYLYIARTALSIYRKRTYRYIIYGFLKMNPRHYSKNNVIIRIYILFYLNFINKY